jgi:hypothetical protein
MRMTTTITSLPSIAILIDCWKAPTLNTTLEACYRRMIDFLDNTDNIKTIALASYNCRSEHTQAEYIWYQNNTLMCHNATRSKIAHLVHAHEYLNKYDDAFPNENTEPLILQYVNPNKHQISMRWWWELEYYLLLHPEIKNIYFCGCAWEECVRNRPLGYLAILEERPDLNILVNTQLVMPENHSETVDLTDDPNWINVKGSTYLYQTIRD